MKTSTLLNISLDKEDLPGFLSVFASKGVFEVGGQKFTGAKEIEQSFHFMLNTFARGKRHCVSNEIVTGNQTEAKLESYLNVVNRNNLARSGSAIQRDNLIKEDGHWKILHRFISIDSSANFSNPKP